MVWESLGDGKYWRLEEFLLGVCLDGIVWLEMSRAV